MNTKVALIKKDGNPGAGVAVSDKIFAREYNEALVHEVITSILSSRRSGTSMQKNRSTRRGGGSKPWRQKGLGRARAGSIRSPLWRGGGVTFGNQQSNHDKKVNKKAYRAALCSILSELIRQDRLKTVKSLAVKEAKTKEAKALLDHLGLTSALIVVEAFDEALYLSMRNLADVDVIGFDEIDPVILLAYENVVMSEAALKLLEEKLS